VKRAARVLSTLLIAGLVGVTGAAAAAPSPSSGATGGALSLTALPADHAAVPTTDQVYVHFSAPIAPLTAETLTIHEVVEEVVGPALAGGTVQTTDDGSTWLLQLPSQLASKAVYEVQVAGAQALESGSTLTTSWRFSVDDTGPPPKALTSLQATAVDGTVVLSWSVPPDFDRSSVVVLRGGGILPPSASDPATVVVGAYPDPVLGAVDTSVLPGNTYTYAAYAVDRRQKLSGVFIAPFVSVPAAQAPVQPTQPAQPTQPTEPTQPTQPTTPTTPTTPTSSAQERGGRLQFPAVGSRLASGRAIRARWSVNPKATYYNLQLFRGTKKLLSLFPARGLAVIPGRVLKPGTYRLVIWSGLGAKRAGRYAGAPWVTRVVRVGGATTASKRSSSTASART
jgi:hypothetical protein